MTDFEMEALISRYYRWWTCRLWANWSEVGIKLGPLSLALYDWDGPRLDVAWLCRHHIVIPRLR